MNTPRYAWHRRLRGIVRVLDSLTSQDHLRRVRVVWLGWFSSTWIRCGYEYDADCCNLIYLVEL